MAENYCYQKFLNLMDTESIRLKDLHYKSNPNFTLISHTIGRNLFDNPSSKLIRSINATWLDSHIDNEADFKKLLGRLLDIGHIVIINDRSKCNNRIYRDYSDEMLKCYIKAFQDNGIQCFWTEALSSTSKKAVLTKLLQDKPIGMQNTEATLCSLP